MSIKSADTTKQKYLAVLEEMFVLGTSFSPEQVCRKHHASSMISRAAIQLKLIEKQYGKPATWIGPEPTAKTVDAVVKVISNYAAHYLVLKKMRKEGEKAVAAESNPTELVHELPPVVEAPKEVKAPGHEPAAVLGKKELIEAAATLATLGVKLGKKDVVKFVEQTLNAE